MKIKYNSCKLCGQMAPGKGHRCPQMKKLERERMKLLTKGRR